MTVPHLAGFINVVVTPDSQTAQLRVLSGVVVTHIKLAVLCRSVRVLIPESDAFFCQQGAQAHGGTCANEVIHHGGGGD